MGGLQRSPKTMLSRYPSSSIPPLVILLVTGAISLVVQLFFLRWEAIFQYHFVFGVATEAFWIWCLISRTASPWHKVAWRIIQFWSGIWAAYLIMLITMPPLLPFYAGLTSLLIPLRENIFHPIVGLGASAIHLVIFCFSRCVSNDIKPVNQANGEQGVAPNP